LVFAAVLVAVALDGVVNFLKRWRISQGMAIGLTLFALLAIIIMLFTLMVPPFSKEFEELIKLFPKGFQAVARRLEELQMQIFGETLFNFATNGDLLRQLQAFANPLLSRGINFFFDTLGGVLSTLLILVLAVMFLADPAAYRQGFIRIFPSFYRNRVDTILKTL
jgi:predicted PurR-regulated permease PerM